MIISVIIVVLAIGVGLMIWRWLKAAQVLDKDSPLSTPRRDAEPIAARLDKLVDDLRRVGDEGAAIRDQYKGDK